MLVIRDLHIAGRDLYMDGMSDMPGVPGKGTDVGKKGPGTGPGAGTGSDWLAEAQYYRR